MSRFTNDVDTISEALNNSFAMMIQSFITITGTITMLLVLDWRLSLIVMVFLLLMVLFIRYNGKRSRKYFTQQQKYLGSINGLWRRWWLARRWKKYSITRHRTTRNSAAATRRSGQRPPGP